MTRLPRLGVWVFAGLVGVAPVGAKPPSVPEHRADDEAVEVVRLIREGTADSLATASLLSHLVETKKDTDKRPDSSALMQRAVALAPRRPELLWLLLRDCQLHQCPNEKDIVARLESADPGNALALLPSLAVALTASPAETTAVIARMGAAQHLTIYWNKLVVSMFDALTPGPGTAAATALSFGADDRLSHVTGVLAAVDIPPFKPVDFACVAEQVGEPGRRAACEKLMVRLDESDSLIAQSLSVRVHQQWWPPGTAEAEEWRRRSLQQHYLVEASGRNRGAQVDADAIARVDAMRHLATEEEVDKAVLTSFNEPLERPADWKGEAAR
jgi:hypothetical protein